MNHVKKITSNGSVNIPIDIRRRLGILERDPVDVDVDGQGRIILTAHVPRCVFCGTEEDTAVLHGRRICRACCLQALERMKGGGSYDRG